MYPRCWLPRRSWRLEHNQCRSLYYFPARLIALFTFIICTIAQVGCGGVPFVATQFFNRNADMLVKDCLTGRFCRVLPVCTSRWATSSSVKLCNGSDGRTAESW